MAQAGPILVPINESEASLEALAAAGSIAKAQKAAVVVVHVIEVVRSLPVNAEMEWEARRGEQLLRQAEEIAKSGDFSMRGELLQSRQAGPAIVDEAHSQQAQSIVLGLRFRRVVGDYELGHTTSYVLKHARCPVWLMREAVRD